MRSFSKKLAFVLAAAMTLTALAPAAKAKAADDFTLNRTSATLYANEGVNDKGKVEGLTGNVQKYDFNLKNKPADWKDYKYVWASSDVKVVTVDKVGLATAVGVGKADVTCTVLDKDGKTAATLKATVEVKANANDVEITNADKYEGTTVEAGDVVDLNRAMYDENGNKTSKRGTFVTDYTRWIAKPSTGVTINQATGEFTFTEEAVAGDYTLYCETYQSKTYDQATAVSDLVTVTFVVDNTFDVQQNNATQYTLKFAAPVKALATSDVTMVKRLALATGNYDYPQAVKSVKLADDGMSATVTLFGTLVNNGKYIISVKGYEDLEFTASLGHPTSMTIAAKDALDGVVLTTGKPTEILVKFYDENGVEVTPDSPTVIFRLETRATDGSYYLAGKNLTIKKEGVEAVVIAEYQGRIENGKRVGQLDTKASFFAVAQAPVVVKDIAGKTLTDWNNPSMTMRLNSGSKKLQVKLTMTDGTTTDGLSYNGVTKDGKYQVTFTALDPSYAVISTTGDVTAFKTGTARFYVNLNEKGTNGLFNAANAYPIAVVEVKIDAKETFAYTTLDNTSLTLGTSPADASFHTGKVTLAGVDSYGAAWPITSGVTVKCTTDGFKAQDFDAAFNVTYANDKADINVDAAKILAELTKNNAAPADGEAAMLFFSATYNNYTVEFSVMIQVPGATDGNYIQIVTSGDNIDALRINEKNKEAAKTVSFEVFEMNNAVKVGKLNFTEYNADASAVTEGTYCYKVTKDGKDVAADYVKFVDNKVTVTLSGKDKNGNVSYDGVGAGTYEFALYRCYDSGKNAVLVQEYSSIVNVYVSDAGSYYVAGDLVSNKVANADDDMAILKCFNINDRNNKPVIKDGKKNAEAKFDSFVVTKTAVADAGYVYVEKITFFESVGDANVPYVVNVDTVLQIGK